MAPKRTSFSAGTCSNPNAAPPPYLEEADLRGGVDCGVAHDVMMAE